MSAHYHSKLNFSWDALTNANESWLKFKTKFLDLGQQPGKIDTEFLQKFKNEINNDLSMPQAIALVWEVFKSEMPDNDKRATLLEVDKVFGLNLAELKNESENAPEEILEFLKERNEARSHKKWKKADELRKKIEAAGWLVEDEALVSSLHRKTV